MRDFNLKKIENYYVLAIIIFSKSRFTFTDLWLNTLNAAEMLRILIKGFFKFIISFADRDCDMWSEFPNQVDKIAKKRNIYFFAIFAR